MTKHKRIGHGTLRGAACAALGLAMLVGSGCVVGQRPGKGKCVQLYEATTHAPYWLYLPVGYENPPPPGESRPKRALVMTFHGMKPFDNDNRQIREWQQEADRYGFVVCAPELTVADLFGPLPLTNPNHPSLKRDERAVIAIMDELYRTVDIDPDKVLATSWSYGGYIAHYMANRYPERFSCIVAKQSNFSAALLDPKNVPRYRDHKVAIFYTENDFAICKAESRQAVEWYARHGFDLTHAVFEKKGHERTPGVAAEFFARTCGLKAKSPPVELARMQVVDAHRSIRARLKPTTHSVAPIRTLPPSDPRRVGSPVEVAAAESPFTDGARERARLGVYRIPDTARPWSPQQGVPGDQAHRVRGGAVHSPSTRIGSVVRIRLSSTIGVAPLLVSYSASMPQTILRGASVLWTDNGEPISNGMNGQRVFSDPGEHALGVMVTSRDGKEYRATRVISVLERPRDRRKN